MICQIGYLHRFDSTRVANFEVKVVPNGLPLDIKYDVYLQHSRLSLADLPHLQSTMYNPAPIHAPIGRAASPNPGIGRSRSPALGMLGNRSPMPQEPSSLYGYSNPPLPRPLSRGPSPAPPVGYGGPPPQVSGFQVEKRARSPNPYGRSGMAQPEAVGYREEDMFKQHVSALISAKDNPFAVSGRIPVDPAQFVLFFRSKVKC